MMMYDRYNMNDWPKEELERELKFLDDKLTLKQKEGDRMMVSLIKSYKTDVQILIDKKMNYQQEA